MAKESPSSENRRILTTETPFASTTASASRLDTSRDSKRPHSRRSSTMVSKSWFFADSICDRDRYGR